MYDLKITNGLIIDGAGAPARRGDIGVRDGRVVALGEAPGEAREVIDAKGQAVAPGFVDIHTHYDAQVFWDPTLSPSSLHGVTTVLGGFCGFSIAPLTEDAASYLMPMLARVEGMPLESLAEGVPWNWRSFGEYLAAVDGTTTINVGFLAGHSTIRRCVMGERAVGSKATPEELERMKTLLRESLSEGALGFSTSVQETHSDPQGDPVPSRHASWDEVLALYGVISEFEGTMAELAPPLVFDEKVYESLAEVSLAAQRPVNWNLLVLQDIQARDYARISRQRAASGYAKARGARVVALSAPQQMKPLVNLANGVIFDTIEGWADFLKLPIPQRIAALKDPQRRTELKAAAEAQPSAIVIITDWPAMYVAEVFSPENQPYAGRKVGEIAAEQGRDPFDVFVDIAVADELRTRFCPRFSGERAEVLRARVDLWSDPDIILGGSDAGAHLDMLDTFSLPTTMLASVRDYGLISLEAAVHHLTQRPAALMGLKDRGVLKEGSWADIVIFDPAKVGARPTVTRTDLPAGGERLYGEADGVAHVIVAGREVIRDGQHLGVAAGSVLRRGRDTVTVPIPAAAAARAAVPEPA